MSRHADGAAIRDPRELRPHPSRPVADPFKLARQVSKYGASAAGMPPITVSESADGVLVIYNGVTRATRIARYSAGTLVPVEITDRLKRNYAWLPKIGDLPP